MQKVWLVIFLLFTSSLLAGCQQEAAQASIPPAERVTIYENEEYDITIYEHSKWKFVSDSTPGNLNVKLSHPSDLNAIITTVSPEKTFTAIKNELLAGAGKTKIISEGEDHFAYQSTLKQPVRTEVYIKPREGQRHLLIIFMSPASMHTEATPYIDGLLTQIH